MVEKIRLLEEYFTLHSLTENLEDTILQETGIDIGSRYGKSLLKNPVIVAPGQLTRFAGQVAEIRKAGYSGCVLKSVVGENERDNCSMSSFRKPASYIKSVYDPSDTESLYPIIHWDGKLDTRDLQAYMEFAREVQKYSKSGDFILIASLLCHLPSPDEDFKKEEWTNTVKRLYDAGYREFEIDFCPQLSKESGLIEKKNILRWYGTIPSYVKPVSPGITVFAKVMNLDFGMDFQVEMSRAALEGGAEGVVIGNRIFKKELGCAHGGNELKERNLVQIREIKKLFPDAHVSGTGGIYSGKDILDYLLAGAENVQILSFLMGKTRMEFKKKGTKFEQVLHRLIFNTEDGLIASMIKSGTINLHFPCISAEKPPLHS